MSTAILKRTGITPPGTLVAAVALIVLGALANLAALPFVSGDERTTVIAVGSALSLLWLAGAWGIWQGWRWAAVFTFVVTVISGLLSVGDMITRENGWKVAGAVALVHAVAVCWLLAQKSTRMALR